MLMRFMELGGPLMWPLLACSVLLGAVLFERLWTVGVLHLMLGAAGGVGPAALAWHRRALPFFVDVPPSIGLLGTVVGVIRSFNLGGGGIDTDAVASGLGVACITTVFGLSIAIVASIAQHLLDWITGQPEPGQPAEAGG
ncbi:MotA/TolQ/ExbB proton channel family protein [Phycisphaera mikurensis]|uniref:MotA/TolQ/ExbB family protein n=1 Tax=Phycisphaera mikurensis (strain NBRC 102666 / KCTC 22515 / FYK2301M01) TaxID=1142394 RepID=I0IEK0_PHYMF|nr:MotA/TolQ/ExbB proton channel family protein [Phycisphaera mikurensis]MBB6441487.1 biopolymer transport protein ExbB [Phycisphaera mikurensis]BAM03688.1 MotA/TolQ/ExbB family protein [Phycisphaera mikurensis NBRC 102666]